MAQELAEPGVAPSPRDAADRPAAAPDRAWAWPALPAAALHLTALWAFAVVQPLFGDLSRNAEFFVARDNTSSDILVFAFALVLVAPAAMMALELLARLVWPPLQRGLHVAFVALLATACAVGVLKRVLPDTSAAVLLPAVLIGAGTAVAYLRYAGLRSVMSVLAVAPVVFLVSFLLFSPVSELVLPRPGASVASASTARTPVVLVIFDELPAISLMNAQRTIDAERVPSFARLARTSTWFRNATTVADGTYVAVPAILTGRRPDARLPTSRQYPHSVFTLVGRGYDIHALEPITHVCPTALCGARPRDAASTRLQALASDLTVVAGHLVLPGDIASSLPPIDRDYEDFGAAGNGVSATAARAAATTQQGVAAIAGTDKFAQRLRDAERYVRGVRRPGRRPPLYVGHFEVPHVPWRLLPSGRQYPVAGPTLPGLTDQRWGADPFPVAQALQRHLLQVGYADALLGRLERRLRAAGLWERALVIVTADHGVGLRPGGSRRPVTRADFPGIAGVPLFVKLPGQHRAAISDGPARTIDIEPTIAAVIGARTPAGVDGTPLTKPLPAVAPSVRSGRTGRFVSLPFATFVRARDAELARQRRLVPDASAVRTASPDAGLIGRRPAAASVAGAAAGATIEQAGDFRHVVPTSGVLPVYVTGHFTRGGRPGMHLAFAVNGRISAVGRSYRAGSAVRFSALLPPASLRAGPNAITVLAIQGRALTAVARAG